MSDLTVFVSSTTKDLGDARKLVCETLLQLNIKPVSMDTYCSDPDSPQKLDDRRVTECDAFLIIVGHLYGESPTNETKSFTELEYDTAKANGKPIFPFLASDKFVYPPSLREDDQSNKKLQNFREHLSEEHSPRFFDNADQLCAEVSAALSGLGKSKGITIIPNPPVPYFAHPYPMPEHWTGRQAEMDQLDDWLKNESMPMYCLEAMGGMGKSSMAWKWLQSRVLPEQKNLGLSGIFQWSFYEGEVSFKRFLEDLSTYLDISDVSDPVTALTQILSEQQIFLILDGFERLLRAYSSADAALLPERTAEELESGERWCIEWVTVRLLRSLLVHTASKVLLISRLVPEDIDGLKGWFHNELKGLDPDDAVAYLQISGIKGTKRELKDAAAVYDFHPLSLSKLVEVLHYDIDKPDDICQAPRYDVTVDLKARKDHILERAYEALPQDVGQFLSSLTALRGKATVEVARFLSPDWTDTQLSTNIKRLEKDRWLSWDREAQVLDFHPIVRRYVYEQLESKEEVHARLVDHFRPLADNVDTEQVESISGLAPVIELYHHTVLAEQYEKALCIYHDLLQNQIFFLFGAYQTEIELLRHFFPDNEKYPLRMKNDGYQSWILDEIGKCYYLSGQSHRALEAFEIVKDLDEKLKADERNKCATLRNLATLQITLGDLAGAQQNLLLLKKVKHENGKKFNDDLSFQIMGRLLIYQGIFNEAKRELDTALKIVIEMNHKQREGLNYAYRALLALKMGKFKSALDAARNAKILADIKSVERDIVRAEWLLGAVLVELSCKKDDRQNEFLTESEIHLTGGLSRCRRINLLELEPDILLSWADWYQAKGNKNQSYEYAEEALAIADRCEYRLKQADIHNFLAQMALDEGEKDKARKEAEIAYECAWCDGPPHCYKPALDEAERLLKELGVEPPKVV